MKTFLLIVLGIVILICCALGDCAEGCCGMPGTSNTPEKDMNIATLVGVPSVIAFILILLLM